MYRKSHAPGPGGLRLFLAMLLVMPQPGGAPYYLDHTAGNLPALAFENGMDVESVDIDGDGDRDIIIANEFQPNSILINDGAGHFTDESEARLPDYRNAKHDSEDIAAADFDRDGDIDIVFVSEDDRVHEYYLNDGRGYFTDASSRLPRSEANAVFAADINGDSYPDLVIGNAGQDLVLINDKAGSFIGETFDHIPAESNVTQDVEMADLDGDGDLDMVLGNEDGNKLLLNNGSGQFSDETVSRLPITASMETRKVTLGDVDGDSDIDIYFANVQFRPGKNRQDRLYINDGAGNFTDRTAQQLPVHAENIIDAKFADIDLDGDPDILLGGFPNRPVEVHINDGRGYFTNGGSSYLAEPVLAEALGIEVADLNGDSIPDIYICDRGHPDRLLLHTGEGVSNPAGIQGGKAEGMVDPRIYFYGNFPNPFMRQTSIEYALSASAPVDVSIFNSAGEHVTTLVRKTAAAGRYRLHWSAEGLPAGRYYCRITTRGTTRALPLMVVKGL